MKKTLLLVLAALICCSTQLSAQDRSYSRFYAGYDMIDIGNQNLHGLSLGWLMGIPLMKERPLHLEVGANGQYAFGDDNGTKTSLFSVNVPVNAVYRWSPINGFVVAPYVGLNFRGNISGEMEIDDVKYDVFDDLNGKRFQMGGNIGVSVKLWKLLVGVGYTVDFMDYAANEKMKNLSISLGLRF